MCSIYTKDSAYVSHVSYFNRNHAFGMIFGVVLSQNGHTIAFFSKKSCACTQVTSIYARGMLVIIEVVK